MNQRAEQKDYLQEHSYTNSQILPAGINTLTILTFIGSAIQVIGAVVGYYMIAYSVKSMETVNQLQQQPKIKGFGGFFKWSYESTRLQYQHRTEILVVSIVAATLCFYGALQMRKLKKQGFVYYTVGEVLFPLVTFILIDFWSASFGFFIAALFIGLYSLQRKHFIHK